MALHGIDAPEAGQRCGKKTGSWRCGDRATGRLAELVDGKEIECAARDRDHYGRIIAVCYADEADLDELLVREGLPWAYIRYSDDYVTAEAEGQAGWSAFGSAKLRRLGIIEPTSGSVQLPSRLAPAAQSRATSIARARRSITHHGRHGTIARRLPSPKVSAGSAMRPRLRQRDGGRRDGDDRHEP